MFPTNPITVKVAIPHFFQESYSTNYGSSRVGNKIDREFAFYNCLSSLLAVGDSHSNTYLDLARTCLVPFSFSDCLIGPIQLDIHIFINNHDCLPTVLDHFESLITLHKLGLDDPRLLPSHASRFLLENDSPFELNYYTEDDLVIRDPYFFSKQLWFLTQTSHRFVLMPHRFEQCVGSYPNKLFVDGPNSRLPESASELDKRNNNLERICASGIDPLTNTKIDFVYAQNPHSGCFILSKKQINYLQDGQLRAKTFISELETAATGSVYPHFSILKPSWFHSWFLQVQHSNPSFLTLLNKWNYE